MSSAIADAKPAANAENKPVDCATDDYDEDYLSLDVTTPATKVVEETLENDDTEQSTLLFNITGGAGIPGCWNPLLPPPWLEYGLNDRRQPQIHPLTALHNEMVSFLHLMEPLPSEIEQRYRLVDRIRATVKLHFEEGTQVEVFGSQATGLFLPSSDIDLVVITDDVKDRRPNEAAAAKSIGPGNGDIDQPIGAEKKLSRNQKERAKKKATNGKSNAAGNQGAECNENEQENGVNGRGDEGDGGGDSNHDDDDDDYTAPTKKSLLQRFVRAVQGDWKDELSYLEAIEHTRIPLVKFTHAPTSISVDVSFNQPTGPPAAQLMKRYLEALPPLRPLTFVLKYFLAARGLNEPYSGGVGSFMLQLLIVAFLQHRERDAVNFQRPSVYNLGSLLLEFFELYGLEFNYYTTGISVRHDGFYFPKGAADRHAPFWKPDRTAMMALENPLDPTLDIGQSSFRYQTVQRAFAVAYRVLLAHVTARPDEQQLRNVTSILATILPPTSYMTSRLVLKRRDRPLSAKRAFDSSQATSAARAGTRQRR